MTDSRVRSPARLIVVEMYDALLLLSVCDGESGSGSLLVDNRLTSGGDSRMVRDSMDSRLSWERLGSRCVKSMCSLSVMLMLLLLLSAIHSLLLLLLLELMVSVLWYVALVWSAVKPSVELCDFSSVAKKQKRLREVRRCLICHIIFNKSAIRGEAFLRDKFLQGELKICWMAFRLKRKVLAVT